MVARSRHAYNAWISKVEDLPSIGNSLDENQPTENVEFHRGHGALSSINAGPRHASVASRRRSRASWESGA
jgi:hypothetical protein